MDIPLHSPYMDPICGRDLKLRFLKWPMEHGHLADVCIKKGDFPVRWLNPSLDAQIPY